MFRRTAASLVFIAAATLVAPVIVQAKSKPAKIAAMPMPALTIYHLEGRRSLRDVVMIGLNGVLESDVPGRKLGFNC